MVSDKQIKIAFRKIKNDMTVLTAEVARLTKENELLIKIVREQTNKLVPEKKKVVTKTITKTVSAKPTYVASKNGGKFHKSNCPYAKNIKPKDRVTLKTKNSFLNKGYKACKCV